MECNTYLFNWDFYYKSQQDKLDWKNSYEEFKKERILSVFYSVNFTREKGQVITLAELPLRLKNIKLGDKVFLSKKIFLPQQEIIDKSKEFPPRRIYKYGIIGSGRVFQELSPVPAMDDSGENPITPLIYEENNFVIGVEWDTLLDFENGEILMVSSMGNHFVQKSLKHNMSGSLIKPEIAYKLEKAWVEYTEKGIQDTSDAIVPDNDLLESGIPYETIQKRYKRNPTARIACLNHYGHSCIVCGFNFEKEYGKIGVNFMHVHHLNQISDTNEEYKIDPIKDLRPVCPNCHAMLHKSNPPFTIEQLKSQIKSSKQ